MLCTTLLGSRNTYVLTISVRGVIVYQLNLKNQNGFELVIDWMSADILLAPYIQDTAIASKKAMCITDHVEV